MSDISSEPSIPSTVFSNLSLGGTLGVSVTVAQLGAALYGVTTVQTFIYHQHRERDPKVLRYSIYLLWVIDSFQFICVCHLTYFYCVKNFGNLMGLNDLPWTWPAFTITSTINGALVTGWYAHRLWKLSRNIWVVLLIGITAVLTFVGTMILGIFSIKHRTLIAYSQIAQWPWYLGGISQTITYVTITIFLTAFLLRRKTGFGRTSSTINLIIMYSFGTCLITSATNIAMLVTYATLPGRFYHAGLAGLLPKLTLNSLLAMLNTRDFLRSKMYNDKAEPVSIRLSRLPDCSVEAVAGTQTLPCTGDGMVREMFDPSRNSRVAIFSQQLDVQVEKSVPGLVHC